MSNTVDSLNIVAIIKACASAKVRSFEYGPIKISFAETDEEKALAIAKFTEAKTSPVVETAEVVSPVVEQDEDLVLTDPDLWMKIATGEILNEETH
jgi:hypothetical protein